ncbi:hypothetical protein HPT27_17675 [Permianibacter sp. IMCC34836]|uniref:hypothetical protein n=1 Tax=Permianibacter fluminis TaxID=2738515 RepID=UPI0015539BA6|nr:hypothetical protein [Permianibacter fluminis]NQD38850.1 hypothetical protein [Permianibacter fluminis]
MNNPLLMVLALSGPSVLIAIVLAVLLIKRKAQDRAGVERLLAAVKAAENDYRQAVQLRLVDKLKLPDEQAGPEADKLVKQRRQYFKQLLSALLNRDPAALGQVEPALKVFSEAHLKLLAELPSAGVAAPAAVIASLIPAAPPSDAPDMQWRMENDRLRREVSLTLSTLNNIFAEYASMFGDENTRRDMSLEEILSSMQKLAEGEQNAPTEVDAAGNAPLSAQPAGEADLAADEAGLDSDVLNESDDPALRSIQSDPFAETASPASANADASASDEAGSETHNDDPPSSEPRSQ